MYENFHNQQQTVKKKNENQKNTSESNAINQRLSSSLTLQNDKQMTENPDVKKTILQGSLSLPLAGNLIRKPHQSLLNSSDENDSSTNSSTSISASTTPPNEFQPYSFNQSRSEQLFKAGSERDFYSPENILRQRSETSRSMSDVFGRRFATGTSLSGNICRQ
jgi:hypothetical protein